MASSEATTFRDKAETCRSLARHLTNERTLGMLKALIAEYSSKAEELERPADFDTPRFEQKIA
jgi:hypothetical protein